MSRRRLLTRLALREYIPWAGSFISWLLIVHALGVEQASRLAAATLLMGAARGLTKANTAPLYRQSTELDAGAARSLRNYIVKVHLASMAAGMVVLTAIMAALLVSPDATVRLMLLHLMLGFPPRYLLMLSGESRNRVAKFRIGLASSGLALILLASVAGYGWRGMAAALILREWIALASTALSGGQKIAERPRSGPVIANGHSRWSIVVEASYDRARRRMAIRTSKALLGLLLGPLGGLVTRTARGSRADRRFEKHIPDNRWGLLALSLALVGGGFAIPLLSSDGWCVLIGCSAIRMGSSTMATLLWGALRSG